MIKSLGEILRNIQSKDAGKYLKHEWQLYAYRLALWLDDMDRISLYMRLAKTEERILLDAAWDFVKDAYHPNSKSKLFMWKLSLLRKERAEKEKAAAEPQTIL
jgi:hypothetical protein